MLFHKEGIRSPEGISPGTTGSGAKTGLFGSWSKTILLLGSVAAMMSQGLMYGQAVASDGAMMLKGATLPRGGVWLAKDANNGHFWVSDGVLGFCRVDPAPGLNPPFTTSNCNLTAKTPGQAVVASPGAGLTGLPANAKVVFVPDDSSKSNAVVRFVFNPATETLTSALTMQVVPPSNVGGGSNGARAAAVALAPNGVDLYVGYTKSGDIMKITNATGTTSGSPTVSKIGATSDGRGLWSMVMFKGDLYLGELGGNGLSTIPSPAGGTGQAACAGSCTGKTLAVNGLTVSSFPGGLAADTNYLYIGDAPLVSPGSILRYDPSIPAIQTYSVKVTSYTATPDNINTNTYSQYYGPVGLGLAPNGDLYVGDDPSFNFVAPAANPGAAAPTTQGHLWKVTPPVNNTPPSPTVTVTAISPTSGSNTADTVVTITGTGFSTSLNGTLVNFGNVAGTNVSCASATSCTATTSGGSGTVDVTAVVAGVQSAASAADQFTYVAAAPPPTGGPTVSSVTPNSGIAGGGTTVTINGTNLTNATAITFGPNAGTSIACAADGSNCTVVSPTGSGTVDIQVTAGGSTSPVAAADKFSYASAGTANLWAFGITAPKGGMVFIPGALGGHFWSSDHANGFCRQDPVPGTTLHAMNYAACDDGSIGSPGQAVYDPRPNADGTHYVYVPDNAVKSTTVWRLTFNPTSETIVGAPEPMTSLEPNVTTIKPNGMALGPDGNLYVTDLTEPNIRVLTNPNGDIRTQTVSIVAVTGDGRGANGTTGFIGNKYYISENRGATWIDITTCGPNVATPCATNPIPLPPGVFVAGVATDPVNNMVYASNSAGGSAAEIFRYNVATNTTTSYVANNSGIVPSNLGSTFPCAVNNGCNRPVDSIATNPGMAFVFGMYVDTRDGTLYLTEDATAGARSGRGRAFAVPFIP